MRNVMAAWNVLLLAGAWVAEVPSWAAEFHVRPDGTPQGDGSAQKPWDLATTLSAPPQVLPGDTVWMHGGTYRGGFHSKLKGTPEKPIVVAGATGERATIDARPRDDRDNALFLLQGADCVYRDFEVTCSDPQRQTKIAGPWPADIRRGNVDLRGDRLALVNLTIHDCASGVGMWSEGEGGEISGCLIFYNGWAGPDRSHGHGVYAQNARGTKRIVDNIVFQNFGYGIHAYGSEKASLKGLEIDRNVTFGNGALGNRNDAAPGIMVGGATPAERIAVRDNVAMGGGMRFGYPWGVPSEDLLCIGNYAEGLVMRDFRRAIVKKNTIVAHSNVVQWEAAGTARFEGLQWNDNDCYVTDGRWGEASLQENGKTRGMSFAEWRKATGCDADSRFTKGTPTALRVIVRPNRHEKGRAHIAVINPQSLPEVTVDLTGTLAAGQKFRIVSARNFYGPAILQGTFDGTPVRLSMKPTPPAPPVGLTAEAAPTPEPRFAAFVVLPGG